MTSCNVCLVSIKKNQFKVQCGECGQDFHGKCVNTTQADMDYIRENDMVFRCEPCNKSRRKSMRLEYSKGELTLETIFNTLKEIQETQKKNTADFNKSYDLLFNQLQENSNVLKSGMDKIEEYVKEIDRLKSENEVLKTKVTTLELRVDDMENYSRRNCVEIQGIPERQGENVSEVVKELGNALNVDIVDEMIDACHRVGRINSERNQPRGIIVKFVRRTDKETLMNKRRVKRDFSTRHMGMAMDTPIYLNDSLSPSRRRLLAQARQLRKEKAYKHLWLRNGNILLRKEDGSPIVEIRTQADLSNL